MRITALNHLTLIIGAAVGVSLFSAGKAEAQFGFSSEMIMDRLDENEDGRIDPDEMSESRMPIANMAQQAGIDASNGLSSDDVDKILEHTREQMQQGGGFGFGGGPGGFGGDRGSRGGFGRGGFGRGGSDREQNNKPKAKAAEPPPRVTMDLQADYLPGDANGDSQIAMSEWLRWKSRRAMAEFFSLDRNADGILTPHELARASTATPVDLAQIFPSAHPSALPQAVGGTPMPSVAISVAGETAPLAATQPTVATTTTAVEATSLQTPVSGDNVQRHTEAAKRSFKILDRDENGSIGDLEWNRSRRLKPKFESAGADLSKAMSEEEFVQFYLKFSSAE